MVLIAGIPPSVSNGSSWFPSPCGDYGSYLPVVVGNAHEPLVVSVPLRGLWFLSQKSRRSSLTLWRSFRPLAGIMVLISIRFMARKDGPAGVSVPLRGLWFLSRGKQQRTHRNVLQFPSPCGDYGSYRNLVFPFRSLPLSFPSPCGDYGSYQSLASDVDYPKRGSFRPLAGIMVLIPRRKRTWLHTKILFPSPCGDYGSYPSCHAGNMNEYVVSFPSPCGDYGSYHP